MRFIALTLFAALSLPLWAQEKPKTETKKEELIQFSGLILAPQDGRLLPVPWATVYLPGKSRGT
ncbi:MAG: hypothetical protein ACKVU2_15675 [Saprospiraceae bacterium]